MPPMAAAEPTRTFLVDLRVCHFYQERGIPAYAQSLVLQFCKQHPKDRFIFWHLPDSPLPKRHKELEAFGVWRTESSLEADRDLQIDVLLTTCFFMPLHGRGEEYLYPLWMRRHAPRTMGIVYDLIPYLFQDRYLTTPATLEPYLQSLALLRTYDHLFAISEASRQDTIHFAGIDPARIHTIPGDIDDQKQALLKRPRNPEIPARFKLADPYLLYIGGEDWRKNMEGLVREFSKFATTHPQWQLAVVCGMSDTRKAFYKGVAAECGLAADRVVCTGLVSDEELVGLAQNAKAMVFPSFYEGLGLPILEAYAAGIPVLGSDNSSIRDLVHPACRFTPGVEGSIAAALANFVNNRGLQQTSLAYGLETLKTLGWDRSADILSAAIAEKPRSRPMPARSKPLLAIHGALPPDQSGIAHYSLATLQSDLWTTHFFTHLPLALHADPKTYEGLRAGNRVFPHAVYRIAARQQAYQTALFVLGNSLHNLEVLKALLEARECNGPARWVYLHEANLVGLWRAYFSRHEDELCAFFRHHYPEQPTSKADLQAPICQQPDRPQGVRPLLRMAKPDGILVNSEACKQRILEDMGEHALDIPIQVLVLPILEPAEAAPASELKRDASILRVGHFGIPAPSKHPELLAEAMAILARKRAVSLTFAGFEVNEYSQKHRLQEIFPAHLLDAPSDEALAQAMARVDVGVQLRFPTIGECSGVVQQLMGLRKPVVVTDAGSYAELPEALALKVPPGVTAQALADAIETAFQRDGSTEAVRTAADAYSQKAFAQRLLAVLAPSS
jgi:glycosyltransferase involved in cell wall biosynthesis